MYRTKEEQPVTENPDVAVLPHDSVNGPCPACGKKPEYSFRGHAVDSDGAVRGGLEVLSVACRAYAHCGYQWHAYTYRHRRSWWARLWSWGY